MGKECGGRDEILPLFKLFAKPFPGFINYYSLIGIDMTTLPHSLKFLMTTRKSRHTSTRRVRFCNGSVSDG